MNLNHKITLLEQDESVVLDITDDTGGLGIKLFFSVTEANRLGQGLMEKARFMVAKGKDDPSRSVTQEFEAKNVG